MLVELQYLAGKTNLCLSAVFTFTFYFHVFVEIPARINMFSLLVIISLFELL